MKTAGQKIRRPVVAGRFYPSSSSECRKAIQAFFARAGKPPAGKWLGAIAPHAGWVCSGEVAAKAISALQHTQAAPELVVIFGAVHTMALEKGAMDDHDSWLLPEGAMAVAQDLQSELLRGSLFLSMQPEAHTREHSIEVLLPFVQYAWPKARIMPIATPPLAIAPDIGRELALWIQKRAINAVYLASTDLTHYGPNYGLCPAATDEAALRWAAKNDLELLQYIRQFNTAQIMSHSHKQHSACGGGAIAATLAAVSVYGGGKAELLCHTNSYEVLKNITPRERADNFVGYAAMALG